MNKLNKLNKPNKLNNIQAIKAGEIKIGDKMFFQDMFYKIIRVKKTKGLVDLCLDYKDHGEQAYFNDDILIIIKNT